MNPVRRSGWTIPAPAECAPHTWQGFRPGKWEGDVDERRHLSRDTCAGMVSLAVRRRRSEHFIRNGSVLTWISIISDPVYLTEP